MRVGPESAVGLREATGAGSAKCGRVRVAVGVDAGGAFAEGLGRVLAFFLGGGGESADLLERRERETEGSLDKTVGLVGKGEEERGVLTLWVFLFGPCL